MAAVAIERSGAALAAHAPEDCACFEAEPQTALARTADDLALSVIETVSCLVWRRPADVADDETTDTSSPHAAWMIRSSSVASVPRSR